MPDYDDPATEKRWCDEQWVAVFSYLFSQNVQHGRVGDWPAWHVAPKAAIWAIESLARPESIGWWVISGDVPTDYISSAEVQPPQHPRKAMQVFANNWLALVAAWKDGQELDNVRIAGSTSYVQLAPLLKSRAQLLMEWAEDDTLWDEM